MASQPTSSSRDGMLEIGQHCFHCGQIDFLPFKCDSCGESFCGNHRTQSSHECTEVLVKKKPSVERKPVKTGEVAALFPDRSKPFTLERSGGQPVGSSATTPLGSNVVIRNGKVVSHNIGTKPLLKLQKWIDEQRQKARSKSKAKFSLNFSKNASSERAANAEKKQQLLEASACRMAAKGDPKVKESDRMYIYVQYVSDIEKFVQDKDTASKKQAVYFSKNWVIGRVLDSVADQLKIINENNTCNDESKRLHLYHLQSEKVLPFNVKLPDSGVKNGDTIFLIRGLI